MADWRKLAKALALADGRIDEKEAAIIRRELLAEGQLDQSEIEFLLGLRRAAMEVVPSFTEFVFQVVKQVILANGSIGAAEARGLRHWLLTDNRIDEDEKRLLRELKEEARHVSDEFLALYEACIGS
jgi:hypothetical protein